MNNRRTQVIERLAAMLRVPDATLVGAAIGTGIAARAATRGGADLLLALSAGRLRSMGAPSITSLLPLRESNAFVMEFACSEILPQAGVPVFFGASAFDPRRKIRDIVREIADAGFHGVVNFPSAVFLDGGFRERLEASGVGFRRERQLLAEARRRGLATLAYVHSLEEAEAMASVPVDIINLNLGWNTGGSYGAQSELGLDEAAEYAKRIFLEVRRRNHGTICVLEGGPIVQPDEMYQVCLAARADGYVGGSTIDRVPLEASMEGVTAAFKAVGVLRKRIHDLERKINRIQTDYGIVGGSAGIRQVQEFVERARGLDLPVAIIGETGTGKRLVARAIHSAARRRTGRLFMVESDAHAEQNLFGVAPGWLEGVTKTRLGHLEAGANATVVLSKVEALPKSAQERLLDALETRTFRRLGDTTPIALAANLIVTAHAPLDQLAERGALDPRLALLLGAADIAIPPLRERLEDLPLLAACFLNELRASAKSDVTSIDRSAYRSLMSHDWPGNVRELRFVVLNAAIRAEGGVITARSLPQLAKHAINKPTVESERDWIVDALRRHRFRRNETAMFLGISRKTLYNKMRAFGLPLERRGRS